MKQCYRIVLKCRKNTESKSPKVSRIKNEKMWLWSKCVECDSTKSNFIKLQEGSGLLSSLEIKTTWNSFSRSCFVLEVLTS